MIYCLKISEIEKSIFLNDGSTNYCAPFDALS